MSAAAPGPPSGTRDFLPCEVRRREEAVARVKRTFALHGFEPLETPAFERLEVLSGKYGEEGDKLVFKILKRGAGAASGEADLALRYDLTVPAVRLYARRRGELPRVFKRYQIGPVWRGERPGRGRFREFMQCDVDVFGAASRLADADVILTLAAALDALGIRETVIRLNSRTALRALMDSYGIPRAGHAGAVTALDKLNKIGRPGVARELAERGIAQTAIDALCEDILGGKSVRQNSPPKAARHWEPSGPGFGEKTRKRIAATAEGAAGLAEIDAVLDAAAPRLPGGARIVFDPALARGLDYYTGPIFEFAAGGAGGSIAGGGRYDELCGMFLKRSVPVCGGSLGIERVMELLDGDGGAAEPRAYVTVWDEAAAGRALDLAAEIRAAGVAAEVDLTGGKLSRQFRSAAERGCRFAVVEGPDERAAGAVALKDLESGAQTAAPRGELAARLRRLAEARPLP